MTKGSTKAVMVSSPSSNQASTWGAGEGRNFLQHIKKGNGGTDECGDKRAWKSQGSCSPSPA